MPTFLESCDNCLFQDKEEESGCIKHSPEYIRELMGDVNDVNCYHWCSLWKNRG